jgi:integrase/recombinase XerD
VFLPRVEVERPQSFATYLQRLGRIERTAEWASLPLRDIMRRDIKGWVLSRMRERKTKRITIKADLSLVKLVMSAALDDERIEVHPCIGIRVTKDPTEAPPKRWADVDGQRKLLTSPEIPLEDKLPLLVVMLTGIRKGEFLALRLTDIDWPNSRLHVQRGAKDAPTKNKRPRYVPLIGPATDALRYWVERVLPRYCKRNPRGLVFPNRRGGFRTSWVVSRWPRLRAAAGIDMRFHDLRHTTGSSLVNGLWGRKWSLDEVRSMLGHSSVTQTEVYAQTLTRSIDDAAACTRADVVHGYLTESVNQGQIDITTWDRNDPTRFFPIPIAESESVKNGTINRGVCTTAPPGLVLALPVDVLSALSAHPIRAAALALSQMRVV